MKSTALTRQSGFTLVELAIVVVLIGILAMVAIPHFVTASERTKSTEAYCYLSEFLSAQERFKASHGHYSANFVDLDIEMAKPTFFNDPLPTSTDWETNWQLVLTRVGASSGYGRYKVAFCEQGFDDARSSIPDVLRP